MLRCEHCGAYIPEKGVFCPRCGEKVTPPEGKRKTAAGKWFGRMLGKFFALLLYLILSAVHMVVIFVCVYGGNILYTRLEYRKAKLIWKISFVTLYSFFLLLVTYVVWFVFYFGLNS